MTIKEIIDKLKISLDTPLRYVNITVNRKEDNTDEAVSMLSSTELDHDEFVGHFLTSFFKHLDAIEEEPLRLYILNNIRNQVNDRLDEFIDKVKKMREEGSDLSDEEESGFVSW